MLRGMIVGVMVLMAVPAMAKESLVDQALEKASTVSLQQAAPASPVYEKGTGRKWLEWMGIIGGGIMATAYEENAFGDRRWSKSVGGTGLAILAVSAISKAMPDPR